MTRDTWHVTRDTWHVTRDMWHMTHGVVWTFSQNFSCLALTVWDLWCCEYLEEKAHWMNQWMNDEAVCRTAPATPGLLITLGSGNQSYGTWTMTTPTGWNQTVGMGRVFGLMKLMIMVEGGMKGGREMTKKVEVKAIGSLSSLAGSKTSHEELRCGRGGSLLITLVCSCSCIRLTWGRGWDNHLWRRFCL